MGETQKAQRWIQEYKAADALQRQNILGYRHYADDVVEYFVQKSIANGIDIIRIFDCLNILETFRHQLRLVTKRVDMQVALSYTLGDAYTLDYWKDMAKRIEDMGADSICIKDMAGLLVPNKVQSLYRHSRMVQAFQFSFIHITHQV